LDVKIGSIFDQNTVDKSVEVSERWRFPTICSYPQDFLSFPSQTTTFGIDNSSRSLYVEHSLGESIVEIPKLGRSKAHRHIDIEV